MPLYPSCLSNRIDEAQRYLKSIRMVSSRFSGYPYHIVDLSVRMRPIVEVIEDVRSKISDVALVTFEPSRSYPRNRVYPGFPTLFWGLSVFFVGDLMGKALWKLVENAARFPRRGGRVLCVHGAVSFHRARPCGPRWLPGRGAMRHVELDRRVLGLQSTDE